MKYFTFALALFLVACRGPNEPSQYQQFAKGDTFPQMSNLPIGSDDWPPPGHFCSNPIVCFVCYQGINARDHDGDGIAEDFLKDFMDNNFNPPYPPPDPFDGFPPLPGGGEWMF